MLAILSFQLEFTGFKGFSAERIKFSASSCFSQTRGHSITTWTRRGREGGCEMSTLGGRGVLELSTWTTFSRKESILVLQNFFICSHKDLLKLFQYIFVTL